MRAFRTNRSGHTHATPALVVLAALVVMLGALAALSTPAPAAGGATSNAASAGEAASTALPDQRAYELVSPPGEGEPYVPAAAQYGLYGGVTNSFPANLPFRAAADGDAVAWVGEPTTSSSSGAGVTGAGLGDQWLSARTPDEGWKSSDITPIGTAAFALAQFQDFSGDLKNAVVWSDYPLTGEVSTGCWALYSRASEGGAFGALFSTQNCGSPLFAGASVDRSQIIFQDEAALTPNAQEAIEVPPAAQEGHAAPGLTQACMFGCNLYDVVGGQLRLVNVIAGVTVPNATFGGYSPARGERTTFSHAISNDGSRIFWTDTQTGPDMEHLFVLENGTSTVPVSGAGAAEYWTATPDGRYAFYIEGGRLWRFDTSSNTREALTGEGAEVQGVVGVNETGADGAYLYFVADSVLTVNHNAHGDSATPGAPNLYLLHEGVSTFVATLMPQDNSFLTSSEGIDRSGDWVANIARHASQVTSDGRHLVFQSYGSLTGYDNKYKGVSEPEVFVYSAEDARLACASCDPTGAPPANPEPPPGASKLPASTINVETYAPRLISENGSRVFFVSAQALASRDTNGAPDVYEWEREGEGSCTPRTPARANAGCVFLLSGGSSLYSSYLVDSDARGENVFFEHVGRLGQVQAPSDHNLLYDARVDGGFTPASQACEGSCQVITPSSPSFGNPPSMTFSGNGNLPAASAPVGADVRSLTRSRRLANALKACRRERKKGRRERCERQARSRYGGKRVRKATAVRAGNERRAK
ncbi:MAG TPA: hypothetical protein VGY76_04945 [Solirubrobacteraceae bacterium]|jgi:hypothetical protein|nr:hypothetical protein [Solirubrobacteraceae bacterium]